MNTSGGPSELYRVDASGRVCPVRVTRTTARRVFVVASDLVQEGDGTPLESIALRALRRMRARHEGRRGAPFERSCSKSELIESGAAWCSRPRVFLMTEAGAERVLGPRWQRGPSPAIDPLLAFGLDGSATAEDVKRAYRRRAREAHPDMGGTTEGFIALQAAYARALAATRREAR